VTPGQRYLITGLWGAWAAFWLVMAFRTKATVRRESMGSRLTHIGPLFLAFLLTTLPALPLPGFDVRFLPAGPAWFWTGWTLAAAGLLFTVWARVGLGGNWSGTVTIKDRHELVTTGPYRIVRHPIYTGLLLALAGSALALGAWRGILGVLIAVPALWWKLSLEEAWLQQQFGQAYADYRRRVPPLIPGVNPGARDGA
jgi:protein-S-isoprenylcysteine O-methyltransferase Ste14